MLDLISGQFTFQTRSHSRPDHIPGQITVQGRSQFRPDHISGQITFFGVNIFQLTTQAFSLTYHTSQPTLCFSSAESIHLINQLHPIKKMSNWNHFLVSVLVSHSVSRAHFSLCVQSSFSHSASRAHFHYESIEAISMCDFLSRMSNTAWPLGLYIASIIASNKKHM